MYVKLTLAKGIFKVSFNLFSLLQLTDKIMLTFFKNMAMPLKLLKEHYVKFFQKYGNAEAMSIKLFKLISFFF